MRPFDSFRNNRMNRGGGLVAAAIASACASGAHQHSSPKRSTYEFSGVVLTSDLHPSVGSIVVATDPNTADEVGYVRTDSTGRFVLHSSIPEIGLAAASKTEWAFRSRIVSSNGDIKLGLAHACVDLTGQIILDDPPPWPRIDSIRIGGFAEPVRGLFGIAVASDHHFAACLPPGSYYAVFPAAFIEQTILFTLPSTSAIQLRSVSRLAATTLPAAPINISPQNRKSFVDRLSPAIHLLGLGETNHGAHEFTAERIQLVLDLARDRNFTLMLIEAGYGEVLVLDDYIKGKEVPLDESIKHTTFWTLYTTAFRESLNVLRDYNRGVPQNRKITLRGIDVQTVAASIEDVLSSETQSVGPISESLKELKDKQGIRWKEFSAETRTLIRNVLTQIAHDKDALGLDSARNRHALSAQSLLLAFSLLEEEDYLTNTVMRDKAMAQLSEDLLALDPNIRATLSAHLMHVARKYDAGAPTLGGLLEAKFGSSYRVYALLAHEGAALARTTEQKPEPVPHSLPRAPKYALESILFNEMHATHDNVTYWDFSRASLEGRRWLHGLHFVRSFGAYYPSDDVSFRIYDLSGFDGAILFAGVTPIRLIQGSQTAGHGTGN